MIPQLPQRAPEQSSGPKCTGGTLVVVNAHIIPVGGEPLEAGTVVISGGRIEALGPNIRAPEGSQVIDARGRTVTPGLVEAHCHLGLSEIGIGVEGEDSNETGAPVNPGLRVRDGINVLDMAFQDFREAGITCANILPGSSTVIGGMGAALKCAGIVVDEMVLRDPTCVKAALGETPKATFASKGRPPSTRMGIAAILRETLYRAEEYRLKKRESEAQGAKPPKCDRNLESLIPVLERRIPLAVHAHRADDIATALRISREFNLLLCLEHATEADFMLDELKDFGCHLAFGPMIRYASGVETKNRSFRAPVLAARAGLPFCMITDHPNVNGKYLTATAALAVSWGMAYKDALRAITLGAAQHAGISDRVGSLEVGKDGDLVIWSGDPLEFTTFVDVTVVNGRVVYRRGCQNE